MLENNSTSIFAGPSGEETAAIASNAITKSLLYKANPFTLPIIEGESSRFNAQNDPSISGRQTGTLNSDTNGDKAA